MFRENIAMLNHKNIFEEIDNYELVLEELSNSKDNTKQTLHNWNQTAKILHQPFTHQQAIMNKDAYLEFSK